MTGSDIAAVLDSGARRAVVELLLSDGDRLGFEALAARLASADARRVTARRCATELHHVHLPKLDDAGLVDWNRDGATVSASERARRAANRPDVPVGGTVDVPGDD